MYQSYSGEQTIIYTEMNSMYIPPKLNINDNIYQSYTNGQTIVYTQTNSTYMPPELIISDNIHSVTTYPFSLETNGISDIELKLNNTYITINNSEIISDKPICIQCIGCKLRVWNVQASTNNSISTKGNTYVDGYNILDFDNNNVKSLYLINSTTWPMPKTNLIQNFILSGNTNIVNFNCDFDTDIVINVSGKNNVTINKNAIHRTRHNLDISAIYCTINLFNWICDKLKVYIKGNGKISGLDVITSANITIIGSTCISVRKHANTLYCETIHGTGNINWILI